jgi:hypothetical protein
VDYTNGKTPEQKLPDCAQLRMVGDIRWQEPGSCPAHDIVLHVSEKEHAAVQAKFAEGWTIPQLMDHYGLTWFAILALIVYTRKPKPVTLTAELGKRLQCEGLSSIDLYNLFGTSKVKTEPASAQRARELANAGLTTNMIATRLGVSARQVRRLLD